MERSDGDRNEAPSWSPMEAAILAAAATGDTVDATDWPATDRRVSAEFLRLLYLGRHSVELDPRGAMLDGLIIDGDLDLAFANIDIPLTTRRCHVAGTVDLTHARTRGVFFLGLTAIS